MKHIFVFSIILVLALGPQIGYSLPSGWQEIKPGGQTLCARGGEFSFLVHKGDPQKILVSFAGGGACWDDFTCKSDRIYLDTAAKSYRQATKQAGIFDFHNKNNPYKNWTHIFIPYCTGDIHLGNTDVTYTGLDNRRFVIHHRGAVNTKAVLHWLTKNYKTAAEINVNGCSAGSYGSVLWTPTIAEIYTQTKILQFGDSGAGVSDSLFFAQWGIEKTLPAWIPALNPRNVSWSKLSIVDIYSAIANYYPQVRFSQFNHEQDRVQTMYYLGMGGNGFDWAWRMFGIMNDISNSAANFRYFIAPGDAHCALNNSSFYTTKSDGLILSEWLSFQVLGENPENVKCKECRSNVK